ncbi:MAG: GNAT family N-acetyltransferase [Terriglobia bacterium]
MERQHVRAAFDCGDHSLNQYIQQFAWQNQNRYGIGTTYVMVNTLMPPILADGPIVIGYYTLAMTEVPTLGLPANLGRFPYKMVPAVLIARLAVVKQLRGKGLGTQLLRDAIERTLAIGQNVGCRCIVVDAYPTALDWYKKFGFIVVNDPVSASSTYKMILDLRTVTKALFTKQSTAISGIPDF